MNRSLALLICVAAIGVSRVAAAKPHVALLPIADDANGEVLDAITASVEDDVSLTSAREITHTIDKLGLGGDLRDRDLQKLVTELEVDALVRGTLERDGTGHVLHVRVYAFGKKSHGFTVHFSHAKSPKFKRAMHDALIDKLALVGAGGEDGATHGKPHGKPDEAEDERKRPDDLGGGDAGDDDGDGGDRKHKQGDDDDSAGDDDSGAAHHKHKKPKHHADHADDDGGDGSADGATPAAASVPVHSANHVAARADLGVSILARSFTFNSTAIPTAPKPYSQSPVPGARFSAELYPFAFGDPTSAAAGLGLAADYDQTLQLSLRTPSAPDTPLPATQRHWSVGLRYRISFGKRVTSPTLTLGLSYGGREFVIDRTPLMGGEIDLPDVDYMIIEPGVVFRLPVARAVALTLGGRGLLVRSAGGITLPDQYGDASVNGVEAELGLEIMVGQHIAFRLAGEFTQIAFTFTGDGTLSSDRNDDPGVQDVFGATDRYIGGVATFAVLY